MTLSTALAALVAIVAAFIAYGARRDAQETMRLDEPPFLLIHSAKWTTAPHDNPSSDKKVLWSWVHYELKVVGKTPPFTIRLHGGCVIGHAVNPLTVNPPNKDQQLGPVLEPDTEPPFSCQPEFQPEVGCQKNWCSKEQSSTTIFSKIITHPPFVSRATSRQEIATCKADGRQSELPTGKECLTPDTRRYGAASMLVEYYIRPAAIRAGILIERNGNTYSKEGDLVKRFGFHNPGRHSLSHPGRVEALALRRRL